MASSVSHLPLVADTAVRPEVLLRFESLGDNCEFGFVQRWLGSDAGGLLRWSTTPMRFLLKLFAARFANIYEFDNIIANPVAGDMVIDQASGLGFHSKMISRDGEFVLDEAARRVIHADEKAKVGHLVAKMTAKLADPRTIFVYKANWGTPAESLAELHGLIRSASGCRLLYVDKSVEPARQGSVEEKADGLLVGYIDSFAPWEHVDAAHINLQLWTRIILAADLAAAG